jgi:hypothetical protein
MQASREVSARDPDIRHDTHPDASGLVAVVDESVTVAIVAICGAHHLRRCLVHGRRGVRSAPRRCGRDGQRASRHSVHRERGPAYSAGAGRTRRARSGRRPRAPHGGPLRTELGLDPSARAGSEAGTGCGRRCGRGPSRRYRHRLGVLPGGLLPLHAAAVGRTLAQPDGLQRRLPARETERDRQPLGRDLSRDGRQRGAQVTHSVDCSGARGSASCPAGAEPILPSLLRCFPSSCWAAWRDAPWRPGGTPSGSPGHSRTSWRSCSPGRGANGSGT